MKCGDEVRKGIKMAFVRFTQGAPDHKSKSERASDRAALGGSAAHRVCSDIGDSAHTDRDPARQPLHHGIVMRLNQRLVAVVVGDDLRRAGDAEYVKRLVEQLREGTAHAVGVDDR